MTSPMKRRAWTMALTLLGVVGISLGHPAPARAEILLFSSSQILAPAGSHGATLEPWFGGMIVRIGPAALPEAEAFIHIPLRLGTKVLAVYVCYKTDNARSFISQTRVGSFAFPSTGDLITNDSTDRTSTSDTCYGVTVPGGGVVVNGVLTLRLTFFFGNQLDAISLGAIAVALE